MSEPFYYDPIAAEKPITFIEKYCKIFDDSRFYGPFKLLDWQKERVIRPLFGWKHSHNGLRRYQELFLLTAKGAGKTPLLSAIALYLLLSDNETSPHVIGMAASFEQANYTFGFGRGYIDHNEALQKVCVNKQYSIQSKSVVTTPNGKIITKGKWTLVSGKPKGRSGSKPSCVIVDEIHEFDAMAIENYGIVTANLFKRQQPLLLVATNAATGSGTFCGQYYNRARAVLDGKSQETGLLPVIYEAPLELDWTSEEAARAANPSIPHIVTFEQLQPKIEVAKQSADEEQKYRRLYLSQQVQTAAKWIDLKRWDSCTAPIDPTAIATAPLYVGLDLSMGDDLCAVTYIYPTPERFHVDSHFWLPQATAAKYELEGIPYQAWNKQGDITLVPEPTISGNVKRQIAQAIIEKHKANKIKAVCYDRYKADECIAALLAAGIVCVPVGQGWGVARGCEELDRRLLESSISVAPNAVLRACGEVVEVKQDDRGNYWPVKPNAKGKYAGKRSAKIDGISALVSGLTEARKHNFPAAKPNAKAYILNG